MLRLIEILVFLECAAVVLLIFWLPGPWFFFTSIAIIAAVGWWQYRRDFDEGMKRAMEEQRRR